MAIPIKNIILYDRLGSVAGYLEIRPGITKTYLRLKQSLQQRGLILSLVIDGVNKILQISDAVMEYEIQGQIDLEYEIFVCIVQQVGTEMVSLASGAINLNKLRSHNAIQEIDNAIKNICSVDDHGHGECDKCPYRDYFFKQA